MKTRLHRLYSHRLFWLLVAAGWLAAAAFFVYFIQGHTKSAMQDILKSWMPWTLRINFLLIVFGVVICRRQIADAVRPFFNKKGVGVLALMALAFLLTWGGAQKGHRIYYDEDIYANAAQNMAKANITAMCNYGTFEYGEYNPHWVSYNKQPNGWPFLMSVAFQLFGVDESYGFVLNNLQFALQVLLVFAIAYLLTGRYWAGFFAGLTMAFIPHQAIWSNTAASEPSAALWVTAAVLCCVAYLKKPATGYLFLMAVIAPFASQMRTESILIMLWLFAAVLTMSPKTIADKKLWSFALLAFVLLLPHLIHLYAVSGNSWGAEGNKFDLFFFKNNLSVNGPYYLTNKYFPVLFTLLAVIGLLFGKVRKRWRVLMLGWFLLFWGIFLFFYAGSYNYGADVRFALVTFPPMAVLAGIGAARFCRRWDSMPIATPVSLLVSAIVLSSIIYLPLIRQEGQEAWGARYDHMHAKAFAQALPDRSIVLTQIPTMFLVWGQGAIQTYAGLNNPDLIASLIKKYDGHVYFHYNYWCNTKNDRNIKLCGDMMQKYDMTEVARAAEQDYDYVLYRMAMKDGG